MAIHICWTRVDEIKKWRRRCPSCTFYTTHLGWFQERYGWNVTCLNCGEAWQDGERCPRPFAPGWRQQNIASAKQIWKEHRHKVMKRITR